MPFERTCFLCRKVNVCQSIFSETRKGALFGRAAGQTRVLQYSDPF